ncbi:MAG: hypothetical protein K6C05_03995 [Anaerovibrio sp.]|uniref:hypothetical protein n=1 Tax=Anaerovibrio sp. TaxID=1872532 RepID=UPI0025DF0840|nr:hypothetical protein [Anaerovibrio sp.]MCR5175992.1 hypothetical protein [Anaerovibrio sp.]
MKKQSLIAGIIGIMMLSTVPAFAATPHHQDMGGIHHISISQAPEDDHDKKKVKPPKHEEIKPAPHHDKKEPPKKHKPNQVEDTRGRG